SDAPVREAFCSDQALQIVVAVTRFDLRGRCGGSALNVVRTRLRLATFPVRQVGIGAAFAGPHGSPVHSLLATRGELDLGGFPALLDDDLGRDVAPGDDAQCCHWTSLAAALGACDPISVCSREPSSP